MYSSNSISTDHRNSLDRSNRPGLVHSQTTGNMHFSSMPSSNTFQGSSWSSSPANQGVNTASLSTSGTSQFGGGQPHSDFGFNSRPSYLPGYLMSATQGLPLPDGGQRFDDPPLLTTKSQSQIYGRTTPSAFGLESSSFSGSKSRKSVAIHDEDAPPTNSVYDMMDDVFPDHNAYKAQQRSGLEPPQTTPRPSISRPAPSPPVYNVIIFGYPPDKYKTVAQLFASLGDTTPPEPGPEGSNWFQIGFKNSWEASRAVRKNGELLQGNWMVGVKWADAAQAEALMSSPVGRRAAFPAQRGNGSPSAFPSSPSPHMALPDGGRDGPLDSSMDTSPPSGFTLPGITHSNTTPSFGKAITLAPSTAAYKKSNGAISRSATGEEWGVAEHERSLKERESKPPAPGQESGMIGKISDLIFGW